MAHKKMRINRDIEYVSDSRREWDVQADSVNAGHRAGKRKRGNSVTKRKPKENVRVYRMDVYDGSQIIALGVDMVTSKPNREDMTEAQWNGLEPLTLPDRQLPGIPSPAGTRPVTQGNSTMREVTAYCPEYSGATPELRFISAMDHYLANTPEVLPDIPADYKPRKYATPKPIADDKWGR